MDFLSSNLKYLRKTKGISIKDMALDLKISAEKIEQAEKKSGKATLDLILSFCDYYDQSIHSMVNIDLSVKNKKAKNIQFLVLDIDGVLTDGGMYYTEKGDEFKKFNSKDGLAMKKLVKDGMVIGFLSNGINEKLIKSRAKLLGVKKVYVGLGEKIKVLDQWVKELKISYANVAYIGDDFNDLQVIRKVGFTGCPSNASELIKSEVDVVLSRKGGDACVREFIDSYL